jgi:hypothetical protein
MKMREKNYQLLIKLQQRDLGWTDVHNLPLYEDICGLLHIERLFKRLVSCVPYLVRPGEFTKLVVHETCSEFLSRWKCTVVLPIPKVSYPAGFSDFRPISLLPCLSKVCEVLMAGWMGRHIRNFGLLCPLQRASECFEGYGGSRMYVIFKNQSASSFSLIIFANWLFLWV